ncbi:DUF397 domain-containing protein [Streptomyces thermoviolaceus]|uniref:DUF397 domain-containing protein n=1 Tax=Streptomyces thermoviolaceus TaxID=1952 RepID=UPI003F683A84
MDDVAQVGLIAARFMGYLGTEWKKSSYSGGGEGNDCVEIARVPPHIAIRDSKAPSRAALTFSAGAFVTFVEALKDGGRALRRDALTPTGGWQPTERVAALLFVDFDGMAAGPEDVISDGLDGGYRSRTGALREVLRDSSEDPAGRFLACVALTRWGDPVGYEMVVRVAGFPESVPWRGATYDRLYGQDDAFGVLADAVGDSSDMVEERGTATQRLKAAESLLNVADRVPFDRHISSLLRQDVVTACLDVIKVTVARGVVRLTEEPPRYDLGLQLALMINAAGRVDRNWSETAACNLKAANPGERALKEL